MREERTRSSKPVEVGGDSRPVHAPVVLVLDGSRAADDELVIGLGAEGLRVILANSGEEGLGLSFAPSSECHRRQFQPARLVELRGATSAARIGVISRHRDVELRRRGGGCPRF